MRRRELNIKIFEGEGRGVLWQPRLDTWIAHHMEHGTMPRRFKGMNSLQIYDSLGCSIRYVSGGIEEFERRDELVRIEEKHPDHRISKVRTPFGEISTVYQEIWKENKCLNSRIVEYPVKRVEDLHVVIDLINRQMFKENLQAFERAEKEIGPRGEPTVGLWGSGFTELIKTWCGLANTYYLLHDYPREVEAYLEASDQRDERLIDVALRLPCRIFALGDHATNEFTPPPILKKYLIPRWQHIAKRLHAKDRFLHSHWDGNSRLILPFLKETHLDGVEALTPQPMGDITLQEIKEAVGDRMVVLDILPVIDFLSYYPIGKLLEFAREVIDMFAPRLILGISDELSPVGEIERVEAISKLVDEVCGLPD